MKNVSTNTGKLLLLKRDSKDKSPNGWLATLLRKILREGIGIENVPSLFARYLKASKNSKEELAITRNTMQEMYKDTISFNSFLRIIIGLFKPIRITFRVEIEIEEDFIISTSITPVDKNAKKAKRNTK